MGLDTSHDCWHGPYSSFNRWRTIVAQAAGYPPLEMMEGFGNCEMTPLGLVSSGKIPWDSLPASPLQLLLNHSDCDGKIKSEDCDAIADALEELLPRIPEDGPWSPRDHASRFIKGLRAAAAAKEDVEFH